MYLKIFNFYNKYFELFPSRMLLFYFLHDWCLLFFNTSWDGAFVLCGKTSRLSWNKAKANDANLRGRLVSAWSQFFLLFCYLFWRKVSAPFLLRNIFFFLYFTIWHILIFYIYFFLFFIFLLYFFSNLIFKYLSVYNKNMV